MIKLFVNIVLLSLLSLLILLGFSINLGSENILEKDELLITIPPAIIPEINIEITNYNKKKK